MEIKNYFLIASILLLLCQKGKQSPAIIPVIKEASIQQTKVNPAVLQNGNSFLQTFAAYWKQGRWQQLINMTDPSSIRKYGKAAIEKKYKKINLAMKLELKSMVDNGDSTYTLNYATNVFATNKILRVDVRVLANDSVKLVINDLNNLFR